ncbi:MAG: class I SAM-dependent methyltransferase, partial [Dehalococcoidia bacterium]
ACRRPKRQANPMNPFHRWYCRSDGWAATLETLIPWALEDVPVGEHPLELGPGPGLTTDRLATLAPRLTCIEIDHRLADTLARRLAGTSTTVIEGDATRMPFEDGAFSSAISLTMLHHVPTAALQQILFAEVHRVLRPGGVFGGTDSTPRLRWYLYHLFDDCMPVDPGTLPARLEAAGFTDVQVATRPGRFRFAARKPVA